MALFSLGSWVKNINQRYISYLLSAWVTEEQLSNSFNPLPSTKVPIAILFSKRMIINAIEFNVRAIKLTFSSVRINCLNQQSFKSNVFRWFQHNYSSMWTQFVQLLVCSWNEKNQWTSNLWLDLLGYRLIRFVPVCKENLELLSVGWLHVLVVKWNMFSLSNKNKMVVVVEYYVNWWFEYLGG